MVGRERDRRAPPYVSYKSWETFLDRVRREVLPLPLPQRFDTSVWRRLSFSGSTESAIKSCLIFLELTTVDYRPSQRMERLVATDSDEERQSILRSLVEERYRPVLGDIDLLRATRGEVRNAFLRAGSGAETSDKAVSFFVSFSQEAGIELHPQLTSRVPTARTRRRVSPERTRRLQETENIDFRQAKPQSLSIPEKGTPLTEIHASLIGLLSGLPREGQEWSVDRKNSFQRAWNAVFDFVYEARGENEKPRD